MEGTYLISSALIEEYIKVHYHIQNIATIKARERAALYYKNHNSVITDCEIDIANLRTNVGIHLSGEDRSNIKIYVSISFNEISMTDREWAHHLTCYKMPGKNIISEDTCFVVDPIRKIRIDS